MNPSQHFLHLSDLSPARRLGLTTWVTLLCLLAWDFSGLDMGIMQILADRSGFTLRDNWWLETVLHTRAKQLAMLVYLALVVMVWWPPQVLRQLSRWQRSEIVVGIALSIITISTLKSFSLTSCPWELKDFGGQAMRVSHWLFSTADGGSGHCFPGGHVSSAFGFMALALPWLASDSTAQRRTGLRILLIVLGVGFLLGLTQTLRGAHFPSHTLWTGFICWSVVLANHFLWGWLAHRRPNP
ncbi:phosphatase PAP2 family protein [Limnohabitans sp.]|jgi:membrane-associated PAP2 superfamily phosphatase|uniref:phosphatase PAP2 family protein n=1 Tax=Limnohabitans sp. TaxID=1907725 RepID=UPI0039BCBC3C|nr:phosphatase PAP2 family protein [Comamonadaceae bacterium]